MITEEQVDGLVLWQDTGEFRLTRDALLLAAFPALHPGDRVCDLGCGVGNVLISLAARAPGLTLDGVELRSSAADLCRRSLADNGLVGTVVTGDLTQPHPALPAGAYDLVTANPPYFPQGTGKSSPREARAAARTEGSFTLDSAAAAAARLCKNGGRFALCLPPERLVDLFVILRAHRLEPKRLLLVQSKPGAQANLALVEARRGGKPGLQILMARVEGT